MAHPVVRGASLCAACDLGQPEPCDPVARIRRDGVAIRGSAPSRSPRPAAASPSTSSGSCDQGSNGCARRACVARLAPLLARQRLARRRRAPGCRRGSTPRARSASRSRRRAQVDCPRASEPRAAALRATRARRSPRAAQSTSGRPSPSASRDRSRPPTRGRRRTRERRSACVAREPQRRAGRAGPHEECEPDEAELAERLGVERVRVADDLAARPAFVPEDLERPGAGSGEWMLRPGVPGDTDRLAADRSRRR